MTLATDFWVTSPISVPQREELWQLGRELIYRFSARPGPAEYTDAPPHPVWEITRPGVRDRDHEIGQGFCSMYDFRYQLLSLPVETYPSVPHEDDCEPDCTWHHNAPGNGWYIRIRLDTGYGYRTESPDGRATWGCGDLHAAIVSALGAWLSARDISWHWENEFTGEIHEGRDGLDALGMSGARAHEWLTNTVRPAISAAHPDAEVTWF
jgi:hypothetical protein